MPAIPIELPTPSFVKPFQTPPPPDLPPIKIGDTQFSIEIVPAPLIGSDGEPCLLSRDNARRRLLIDSEVLPELWPQLVLASLCATGWACAKRMELTRTPKIMAALATAWHQWMTQLPDLNAIGGE